jgi:hypothetical protein
MTTTETPAAEVPILLGHRELQRIFPNVAEDTVYRWNSASGGRAKQLPEPFREISGTPIWTEEQIVTFAAAKRLDIDADALTVIRRAQSQV